MPYDAARYDDSVELTAYVFHNCRHLLNEEESLANRAALADEKAARSGTRFAAMLTERWGVRSDPRIEPLLRDGVAAFRSRVRERLLADHAADIVVNRCPACGRIVATPRARQCLWCGHDWHAA